LEVALATPPDAEHGSDDAPAAVGVVTAHDPVCHMDINPATAAGSANDEAITYYFCSRGCLLDFTEYPVATLASEAAYDHSLGPHM